MTEAEWWTEKETGAWERVKEALKRDWEQTKADFTAKAKGHDLHQEVGDTLKQAMGTEFIPPGTMANPTDVATGKLAFDDVEPALRYGVGASSKHADVSDWNDTVEQDLAEEWDGLGPVQPWHEAKPYVRQGWEASRSEIGSKSGKVGWALLWLLGIPLPILFVLYLIRGH